MRNTTRQIQAIIIALKVAKFTKKNVYLTYIDFLYPFRFIDCPRLLAVMKTLDTH